MRNSIQRVMLDLLVIAVIGLFCWVGYNIVESHDKAVYRDGFEHGFNSGVRANELEREMELSLEANDEE